MSVWKIALGVFLGMTLFAMLASFIAVAVLDRITKEQSAALEAIRRANENNRVERELTRIEREEQARRTEASQAPRCIDGRLIEHSAEGWKQTGRC